MNGARRAALAAAVLALALAAPPVAAQSAARAPIGPAAARTPIVPVAARTPIVLVQSLPITGPLSAFSKQVIGGVRAHVEHVNAEGGVHGRRIELLTLDDGGDPALHEANLRRAAAQGRVAAFLNCAGDAACARAAQVAADTGIPLIGPMSGLRALREAPQRLVVPLRASHEREAAALLQQARAMGIVRIAALSDGPGDAEHLVQLRRAAAHQGVDFALVRVAGAERSLLEAALRELADTGAQALLVDLSPGALDELAALPREALARMPRVLLALATPSVTNLSSVFREHVIGFATVVPNPDIPSLPLVRDFERQSARHGAGTGMFEALEAYVAARICVHALRQAGPAADARALAIAVRQLGSVDLGGLVLTLDRPHGGASEWVQIALRGRDGRVLK